MGLKGMDMELFNPFEQMDLFSKALPMEPTSSTVIGTLHHTGGHLGHGQDLGHWSGKKEGGRKAGIERYTTSPRGQKMGPFKGSGKLLPTVTKVGKADVLRTFYGPNKTRNRALAGGTVAAGALGAVTIHHKRKNSNIPDGANRGKRL